MISLCSLGCNSDDSSDGDARGFCFRCVFFAQPKSVAGQNLGVFREALRGRPSLGKNKHGFVVTEVVFEASNEAVKARHGGHRGT